MFVSPIQKFASTHRVAVQPESVEKLERHLAGIIANLPDDLQSVLNTWHTAEGFKLSSVSHCDM